MNPEKTSSDSEKPTEEESKWDVLSDMPNFDEAKEKRERLGKFEFKNLSPEDNLAEAAELLFSVDPYIFPDFFGTTDQAKRLGSALFSKDPNALFSFDKTVIAKDGERIASIICFRDHNCTPWDTEAVTKRFLDAGAELPEHFLRANEQYMKKITDEEIPEGGVELSFGATSPDYRRQGLLTEIENKIIKDGNYKKLYADVLEGNEKSFNLHLKQGFKVVNEFACYPDGRLKVFHMEREVNSPESL